MTMDIPMGGAAAKRPTAGTAAQRPTTGTIPVGAGLDMPAAATGGDPAAGYRLMGVDALRGLVIVLMALDHVRDFWNPSPVDPMDLEQGGVALFLTRFITHFCAPVFILLAGVSASLQLQARGGSTAALSRSLLTRGLWLMLLEVTVVSFSWQFIPGGVLLQVIWVIGFSMVVLSGLVWLPRRVIAAIALVTILGHNLLDGVDPAMFGAFAPVWGVLHQMMPLHGTLHSSDPHVFLVYPLIPWFAVMALGYVIGPFLAVPGPRRDALLVRAGLGMVAAFVVLRVTGLYGDANPWIAGQDPLLEILDVTKYPPSLCYLLVTLGPALALFPMLDRWRGPVREVAAVFGRVPMFFYLIHLPFIHLTALVFWQLPSFGTSVHWLADPAGYPVEYVPNLARAYAAWVLTIAALYLPCRWFAGVKSRNKSWWLSYI